jgi:hypothetical protein
MRKLNKGRLLALLLAATAVIALAGSATASAAVWKDGGVEVTKAFKLGLAGGANYEIELESGLGALNCEEHMTLASSGVGKNSISTFKSGSCLPLGTLGGCTVTAVEAIGLPWTVTLGAETLTVTGMHIRHKFKGTFCPLSELDKTLNVTFEPDNPAAIKSFDYFAVEGSYRQFGTYSIEAPNSGTYGIG